MCFFAFCFVLSCLSFVGSAAAQGSGRAWAPFGPENSIDLAFVLVELIRAVQVTST